jgi:hypothetical protein
MKFNLKKIMAGALMAMVLVPGFAFAEGGEGKENSRKENKSNNSSANFCARINSVEQKITDQITKAETKQSTHQGERLDKITKKESEVDAKRAFGRGEADTKRVKNWDKMLGKAKTEEQKVAVEAYKTSISNAVSVRRTAIDTAVKAYRDGLTGVLANHNAKIAAAVATFKASMDTAVAKAKADCTAGVASQTVKDAFNKSVSDARTILQTARKDAEVSSGLTALKKARNDAVELAIANFKTATEKARADLMLVLKK